MTRWRLALALWAALSCFAVACSPVYYVGTAGIPKADARDGGDGGLDGGDAGLDGGDAGLDGGDAGLDGGDAGTDAGLTSCVDIAGCGCGDFCGSTAFDGGACIGAVSDSCQNSADCMDEGGGALCLFPAGGDAGCAQRHCYAQPQGGSCGSDLDCPCTSACAQPSGGGPPACFPIATPACTSSAQCGGGICVNVYRDGGVCGGVCRPTDS